MMPASMFIMHEKAWNCYPYCRTGNLFIFIKDQFYLYLCLCKEYSIPGLGDRFSVIIESIHLPDNGSTHNV